ncbi:GIY-YIG nuclease family protein [Microbacterium sp. USHLN186]|uniref:GIY-YIG nuclease family protein n=1 Tax=Microbacterium sp. USHLN186 TaxID=3081286 RepID=UPI00301AB499
MYIVECADGAYYTGSTNGDVAARVWEHNHDDVHGAAFTRRRRPVRLVYAEDYASVADAYARERQVHGWSRRKKLALIEGRFDDLPQLSQAAVKAPQSSD